MRQHSIGLTLSRRLAFTPLAETIRRRHQLGQPSVWPMWLDDLLLGGFLIYAAWRTTRDPRDGQRYLAGAWGVTAGMAYLSFFGQLQRMSEPDPAPIGAAWVVGVKGIGLLLAIAGLLVTLKTAPKR